MVIRDSFRSGSKAEKLFSDTYSHLIDRKSLRSEDMGLHYDYILKSGLTVDVKAYTKVKSGFVCIEVINVRGDVGWCHPFCLVDLIAFRVEFNRFHTVLKNDLLHFIKIKAGEIPHYTEVNRSNTNWINPRLYQWRGRVSGKDGVTRKDVFTYITKNDLLRLKNQL